MRDNGVGRAIACVGAMVGAGFASGREIVAMFTRYGAYSWGLVFLSALVMSLLYIVLRHPAQMEAPKGMGRLCKAFRVLLLSVTGGAMMSACGEVIALMLPLRAAYWLGVAACMLTAYWLSGRSLRPLATVSLVLVAMLIAALVLVMSAPSTEHDAILVAEPMTLGRCLLAALFAVGYACLNVSLSMGVICGPGTNERERVRHRGGIWFGVMMTMLMLLSNALYLRHPEMMNEALPIVRLLSTLGTAGFWIGASLLLLALMTSLISVIRGLRCEIVMPDRPVLRGAVILIPPLLISLVGFSQIVGAFYPLLGVLCIVMIYAPMAYQAWRRSKASKPDA